MQFVVLRNDNTGCSVEKFAVLRNNNTYVAVLRNDNTGL